MRTIKQLMDCTQRRALITGGAGHIGRTVAEGLVELGCQVALLDQNAAACDQAAQQLNQTKKGAALAFEGNLSDEAQTRSAAKAAIQKMGGLDVLIHCAAYVGETKIPGWAVPFQEQSVQAWDSALRVNLTAGFILAQEAEAALAASGHGSIILVGSIYGMVGPDFSIYTDTPMQNPAGYGASKGGLLQLVKYLSTLMAPRIRVNAVSPGGVARNQPQPFTKRYIEKTPMKRMATEEDLKGAVAYLASDLSAYVTGHNLVVDGGWSVW